MNKFQINKESRQVFVAMSFELDKDKPEIYRKGMKKALEDSGYDPMFLNEEVHNEKIDDKIILEIRRSKFVIVDVTGHRPNVYFEAGFALGEGIPVIWTCNQENWDEEEAQFDTRQYNYLIWDTDEDLYTKLKDRIEATFGVMSKLSISSLQM